MTTLARTSMPSFALLALLALLAGGCAEARERPKPRPVWEGDVALLLERRCARCHREEDARGGYRVDAYLQTLSCTDRDPTTPAVQTRRAAGDDDAGDDASARGVEAALLSVLDRQDHRALLDADERARLRTWIAEGVPLRDHGVHAPGILDPRSMEWHGRLAARERHAALLDAKHPDACGRCHTGTPGDSRQLSHAAAGAPACTSCHDQPNGVLACGTCHGDGDRRAFPPRDACLFGDQAGEHDAHAVHVGSGALQATNLPCRACHAPADATLSHSHADGTLDVRLEPAIAGPDARFEPDSRRCATYCHDHGGARPQPRFDDPGPMRCGDCHGAPPRDHYAGACDDCHVEPNADGTALSTLELHLDGDVDVGPARPKGRGCAACHGGGDDPMPYTPSHRLHRATTITAPIACTECHALPDAITSEGHLDRGRRTPADVTFGPLARARDQSPRYEGGTCREVACHGAGLSDDVKLALRWDERASGGCATCHGSPPAAPHPQQASCAASQCHGDEVRAGDQPGITGEGRQRHIDGHVDHGAP